MTPLDDDASTLPVLLDGYTDLPPGVLANVVTFLEMTSPPPTTVERPPGLSVRHVERPELGWYRALFKAVGEDWLWSSRAVMTDAELGAALADPTKTVYALDRDGRTIGFCELHRDQPGEIEISLFGVVPEAVGSGAARYLMGEILKHAFAPGIRRVWLHTCTFDHPGAVRFYQRNGFVPFKFAIELMPDPRLTGHLPETAAPHVALIRPKS